MAPQTSKSSQITFSKCSRCSPDGVCIPFPPIGIMLNIWCMCEKVFGGLHHFGSLPTEEWYDDTTPWYWCWCRLTMDLIKVCPRSLPSTTYLTVLKWSSVPALPCATWCTYSRPNVLARFGGGGEAKLTIWWCSWGMSHRLPKVANHYSKWLRLPPARCLYTISTHRHNVEGADALREV